MTISASDATLRQVSVARIERNKENPRILFRQQEMDRLLESVRRHGIQVPLTVYRQGNRYVLIDGERRWRCAIKLNLKHVPALVQDKPDRLTNILLMFNIHALREQWDLLTIALKLRDVKVLFHRHTGKEPTEIDLASQTGLSRGTIRRCRLLLALPQRYKDIILSELRKPKPQQKLTEDFFIEMERALTTVSRAMPDTIENKDRVRRILIKKFKADVIPNRVHFRDMARIARATNVASDVQKARRALKRLFADNSYSIKEAYEDSVSEAYAEREILTRLGSLIDRLQELQADELDDTLRKTLHQLLDILLRLFGN
jgi:ParB/RepB/Spo0J family partition protein